MKVIVKEPHHFPVRKEIENDLRSFQQLVGGQIEHVNVSETIGMLVNEEGKLNGLEKNFKFRGDTIVGTAVFVGYSEDDFTDCPVNEAAIRAIIALEE